MYTHVHLPHKYMFASSHTHLVNLYVIHTPCMFSCSNTHIFNSSTHIPLHAPSALAGTSRMWVGFGVEWPYKESSRIITTLWAYQVGGRATALYPFLIVIFITNIIIVIIIITIINVTVSFLSLFLIISLSLSLSWSYLIFQVVVQRSIAASTTPWPTPTSARNSLSMRSNLHTSPFVKNLGIATKHMSMAFVIGRWVKGGGGCSLTLHCLLTLGYVSLLVFSLF